MARFQRRIPVPTPAAKRNYAVYRPYVRQDFEECCAYCLRHEDWAEAETFELDHFRPHSRFPDDRYNFYNLYYSCRRCNLRKLDYYPSTELIAAGVGFVDYCAEDFAAHFEVSGNGLWLPQTESARFTLRILRLNSEFLVRQRLFIRDSGFAIDRPTPSG